ncbi:MAG: hypothetical protein EXS68_01660 [Candidatus Ryanbacteria bacterium]|nr:hypothetical protein [Candidatus Ryanbacteria bacterium]
MFTSFSRQYCAALLLGFFFLFSASIVFAATGLTIQPIKISVDIEKGRTISDFITITNAGEDAVQVEVKVEDFIPSAGGRGVQFVGRAPGVTTVRDWISINHDARFVVPQNGAINVPYTIAAPINAEPGSHFGVVFFRATKISEKEDETEQLKVGTQVGMLVLVTVPGSHLQKGRILNFTSPRFVKESPVEFNLKFENTGTVHFEPKGTITIRNIFDMEVGSVAIEGGVVLPTGIEDLKEYWDYSGALFGIYTAEARVRDGEGETLTAEKIRFYAFPIKLALTVFGIFIFILLIIRFIRRRVSINISLKS